MKDETEKHEKAPDSLELQAARVLVNETEWSDKIDELYDDYIDDNDSDDDLYFDYCPEGLSQLDSLPVQRKENSEKLVRKLKKLTSDLTETTNIPQPHYESFDYAIQERFQARYVIDLICDFIKAKKINIPDYKLKNHKIDVKKTIAPLIPFMKYDIDNPEKFSVACFLGYDNLGLDWLENVYQSDLDFVGVCKIFEGTLCNVQYVANFKMPLNLLEEELTYDDIVLANWETVCEYADVSVIEHILTRIEEDETLLELIDILAEEAVDKGDIERLRLCLITPDKFREVLIMALEDAQYEMVFTILQDKNFPVELREQVKNEVTEKLFSNEYKMIIEDTNSENVEGFINFVLPLLSDEKKQVVILEIIKETKGKNHYPGNFELIKHLYPHMSEETISTIKVYFNKNRPDLTYLINNEHSHDRQWENLLAAKDCVHLLFGEKEAVEFYDDVCNPARFGLNISQINIDSAILKWTYLDEQTKSDFFVPVLYYLCWVDFEDESDKNILIDWIYKNGTEEFKCHFIDFIDTHQIDFISPRYSAYWLFKYSPYDYFNRIPLKDLEEHVKYAMHEKHSIPGITFDQIFSKITQHKDYTEFCDVFSFDFDALCIKTVYNQKLQKNIIHIINSEISNMQKNDMIELPLFIKKMWSLASELYFNPSYEVKADVFQFFRFLIELYDYSDDNERDQLGREKCTCFLENLREAFESEEPDKILVLCDLVKNCLSDRPNNPILRNRGKGGFALKGFFKHRNPIDGKICQSKAEMKLINAYYSLKGRCPGYFPEKEHGIGLSRGND